MEEYINKARSILNGNGIPYSDEKHRDKEKIEGTSGYHSGEFLIKVADPNLTQQAFGALKGAGVPVRYG